MTKHFDKKFLKNIEESLIARKEKLRKQLSTFAERDPRQEDNFNADFPNFGDKDDDNAAEVAAFESNLSLEETFEQSIEMVNKALSKLENNTYGLCEKCDNPIAKERLEIMPTATKCAPGHGCQIKK